MIEFSLQHILKDSPYDIIAIIVDNRNPNIQAITADFNETAKALSSKPQ